MRYNLPNGKYRIIPQEDIDRLMRTMGLTKDEAIQLWLEDEGELHNEEQEALEKKAQDTRITATIHQARAYKPKTQKERVHKEDATKEKIISAIAQALRDLPAENVQVVNVAKLITFSIGNEDFTVNLSRKNKALAEKRAKEKAQH